MKNSTLRKQQLHLWTEESRQAGKLDQATHGQFATVNQKPWLLLPI